MLPAKAPCICIDTNGMFIRLHEVAPVLLWLFTIFCALMAVGMLLGGVLVALANSWFIRAVADFIRGEKRKRKNGEL